MGCAAAADAACCAQAWDDVERPVPGQCRDLRGMEALGDRTRSGICSIEQRALRYWAAGSALSVLHGHRSTAEVLPQHVLEILR